MTDTAKTNDVKIKVINSDKLIKAINEGSYEVNLSAVMALGAVELFGNSEQLPSALATDTISRQAAIDTLDVGAEFLRRVLEDTDIVGAKRAKYEWGLGLIEAYIADVKALPSAQPERKKGCKIVKSTGYYGYCACDQCNKPVHLEDKFCSNCGADFREEDA